MQKLDLKIKGLYLHPSPFSETPAGALFKANNVVLDKESTVESRRGQNRYGDQLTIVSGNINKLYNYKQSLLVNYNDKLAYDSDGDGLWIDYSGTYNQPDEGFRIRSVEANRNFYFTTSDGVKKLDSITGTPVQAGAYKALDGEGIVSGSTGFMSNNTAVAYRLLWGYKDANNNLILGSPSQRVIVSNSSGGSRDVSLIFNIPDGITTKWFYQLYRSGESASATSEPNDELQQVAQGIPTSAQISAKAIAITDTTPNDLRGAALYTNPNQQGIQNANEQPPFAKDMVVYKGFTLYANTRSKNRFNLTLIGVGSEALHFTETTGDITDTSPIVTDLEHSATLTLQDLTYTAADAGPDGNLVSIEYTSGGTAGAEVVTVTGDAISIQIQDGVSTATQIKTAFDLVSAATDLASVAITGTGSDPQDVEPPTFLEGGHDTTMLAIGMRAVGTGIPSDTFIISIDSASQVTLNKDATATTNDVAIEFQDVLSIGTTNYYATSGESAANQEFEVVTDGTPAENIQDTALSLVRVINEDPSNTAIYAYYTSGFSDLPGHILLEERGIGGDEFAISSTAGEAFDPILPAINLITAIDVGDPSEITSLAHGLIDGDRIVIYNSNSTPSIDGTYVVNATGANTFEIDLPAPVTVAGTYATWTKEEDIEESDNDTKEHRVAISKFQQPEAVPLLNFLDVGSADAPITRILALRDSVFIFKQDGIFRITGEDVATFRVSLFDNTAQLLAPESAVTFNNQVFCFSDQGVVAVSDNGVAVISRAIEGELLELSSSQFVNFADVTFAIGYESERKYILFTNTETDDTYATQAYVYNSFTNSWTRWVMDRTCGIVNIADNKLYMGHPTNDFVYQERKNFELTDYADESFAVSITAADGDELSLSSTTVVEAGMTIVQGGSQALVTEVVDSTTILINVDNLDWEVGAATVYTPIPYEVEFLPQDVDNPGITKQFREITLLFRDASFDSLQTSFTGSFASDAETQEIEPVVRGGWGTFGWGAVPWGGGIGGGQQAIRTLVPLEQQRSLWLSVNVQGEQAFTSFSLAGISFIFNPVSERFR